MVRAWHGRGMASVNQTRPHCVNQMGKTHSKPLAARHAICESALTVHICSGVHPVFHPLAAESHLRRKIVRSVETTTQIRLGEGPTMRGILPPLPLHVFMI